MRRPSRNLADKRDSPVRFANKIAIVTGAAGGIGQATVARFAREGAKVLAIDKVAIDVGAYAEFRDRIWPFELDISLPEASDQAVEELRRHASAVDFLINNAGIGGSKSIRETASADWDRFLQVNLTAVFHMCRSFLPLLPKPGGRIVNISSVFGLTGFPGSLAYSVSKAGVAQLTRQLAVDLAPDGILVNAIAPGIIETPMTLKRVESDAWYRTVMCEATPLGRNGQPDDIAGVAAFLCSDDAAFVAGQVLTVDGGWLESKYLQRDVARQPV
jgi:meso-butanediol dehydrogenase / (S,S)-butanediol dehydrogenase / diacetyl reductase